MRRLPVILLVVTLSWLAPAAQADDASGSAAGAAAGSIRADFNNDGFTDLAIGAPGEDVGALVDAGAVNVLYGSATGLQALSPHNQFWDQASSGTRGVAEAGDRFGTSIATGDFNNDGFTDLAVGAPGEDVKAVADAGAVNVLYGSATGLQSTSPDDQFWTQGNRGLRGVAEAGDAFGSSLEVGDFNNDGFIDLAVGVPDENAKAVPDAGAVNVLYGSATGLQATSPDDQFWSQGNGGLQDTRQASDQFGFSLAGGDFNADGFDDLAVGVPLEDVGSVADAGTVSVLYGSATGLQSTSPDDQLWAQGNALVRNAAESGDQFGGALSAGDFNGDGFADLAVGAPGEDVGTAVDAGAANVLYGSPGGLQSISPDDQFWTQSKRVVRDAAQEGDQFGATLSAGDFNGDGFADLAVGAPGEDVGTAVHAGATNVLYGSATRLQANSPDDQFWTQNTPDVLEVAQGGDQFGSSLRAGDFNDDGFADLAVGVPREDVRKIADAGAVSVLYGSAARLQATSPDDQFWNQDSLDVLDAAEAGDGSGLVASQCLLYC
ncbi:MAG: FG-GAP-like repeat-containing protein [Actinomycetota bacterium]|nr:FG-GAP-like repeat-containing protein [Actinomycetota bacterium]